MTGTETLFAPTGRISTVRHSVLIRSLAVIVFGVCLIGGCSVTTSDSQAAPSQIQVFAAASLSQVFDDMGKQFHAQHPEITIVTNFAGSQTLVDQIFHGAQADVLATADSRTMDRALSEGLVTDPQIFATNTLVLITPKDNPAGIRGFDSTLTGTALVVCAPAVPCGATTQAIASDLGISLHPVSEEQSVTDVANKVVSGQADAGVVYATDARQLGDEVKSFPIPRALNHPNTYPIARTVHSQPGTSSTADAAQEFIDFVLSPQGRAILRDHGFELQD
ncbi:molybdate ABC transporter substrate-binding protein [Schaalia sp. ZJ1691]|uniref:molybdate ABC transporter substrate-binding protein n=1 Tax=Schaalia sp. ZJ1691 TaxID=2709404 RepID=UPI0013EC9811|nr:molybdate ABC transporter substrate-binding protein [Schaalia sp. ZJ1691]